MRDTKKSTQRSNTEKVSTELKLSDGENQRIIKMCRLEDTAGDESFSKWYKELFAKHQDRKYRSYVIATAIENCYILDEAEVPIYPTLVKTILNRDWTAPDIGNRADLMNAARGLSPFAVVDLTE